MGIGDACPFSRFACAEPDGAEDVVTTRGDKVGALKSILERAGLITCLGPYVIMLQNAAQFAQKWVFEQSIGGPP